MDTENAADARFAASNSTASRRRTDYGTQLRLVLVALAAIDALMLVAAVVAAGLLRLKLDAVVPVVSLGWAERHVAASIVVVPVLLVLFRIHGLYDSDRILVGTREYAQIAHAATYGVLLALALSYFAGGPPLVSRSWLLLVWLTTVVCVGAHRFGARRVVRLLRRHGRLRRRVMIVGASADGVAIAAQLGASRNEGLDVIGFLDEYLVLGEQPLAGVPVLGRPGDLVRGSPMPTADEYILVPQALPHQRLEEITRMMLAGRPSLHLAVSSSDLLTHGVRVIERGSVPLATVRRVRLGALEGTAKRVVDAAGAALALIALAPLALAALLRGYAAGVRPLLRRHAVYGAGGNRVTMQLYAPGVAGWLPVRGVPALLCVLRGTLSLVGPRPVTWRDDALAPPALWLTSVKPGLTGPWRLSGPDATLADQATQDLSYVRNYSLWEDARILWESLRRVVGTQRGPLLSRWHRQAGPERWTHVGVARLLRSEAVAT